MLDRGLRDITEMDRKDRTNLWLSKRVSPFSVVFPCHISCASSSSSRQYYSRESRRQREREKGVSFFFLLTWVLLLGLYLFIYLLLLLDCCFFFPCMFFFLGMWIIESWNCCLNWALIGNGKLSGERWSGFFGTTSSSWLEEKGFFSRLPRMLFRVSLFLL